VKLDLRQLRPRFDVWKRILVVGLPAGGEFALLFVYMAVIYAVIRDFGAAAQAGFGVGSRVMQAVFLPAMAIAFAVTPIAAQNFGAKRFDRVRATFRSAAWLGAGVMAGLTVVCQWQPVWLLHGFTKDPAVLAVGEEFLHFVSWNFVASGFVFTCSGMFQALGNTLPSLASSATRILTFALPALWLSGRAGFELRQLWTLSVATVAFQALVSAWLLKREFRQRLAAV
jgi:Na+-driven multidrug efflux pump